jgi:hypothetical protein
MGLATIPCASVPCAGQAEARWIRQLHHALLEPRRCSSSATMPTHRTRAGRFARGRAHRYARCIDSFLSLRWLRGLLGLSSSPNPRERGLMALGRDLTLGGRAAGGAGAGGTPAHAKRTWRARCAARGPDACVGWAAWDHAAPATTSVRQPPGVRAVSSAAALTRANRRWAAPA